VKSGPGSSCAGCCPGTRLADRPSTLPEITLSDSPGSRGRTVVTWLVTLLILGVVVLMSVNRARVEDEKPVHHSHDSSSQTHG